MPFCPKTFDFLFENRLQNSKAWFDDHQEEYRQLVLEPLQELSRSLAPVMLELDPQVTTEPRVDKTICRIRRDTRFSRDKSLYRDNMWLIFKRGKMHGTQVPGLYFDIAHGGFSYGCGFYDASTQYMENLRRLLLCGDRGGKKAVAALENQNIYGVEGECYRRPRYPQAPPELRKWLERRNIYFTAQSWDQDLLYSSELGEVLSENFRLLAPIYQFLLQVSQCG